jgi:S1-C subfamily serine protease
MPIFRDAPTEDARPGDGRPPAPLPPARPLQAAPPAAASPFGTDLPAAPPTYEPARGPVASGLPRLPAYDRPDPHRRSWSHRLVVGLILASALVATLVTASLFVALDRLGDDDQTVRAEGSNRLVSGPPLDIQALLSKAQPSVVTIHTEERGTAGGLYSGAGTGVILSDDGSVVTNAHVVQNARALRVTLHDGTEYPAELMGSFPQEDVALIQLRGASGLVPAELGGSGDVRVGDEVVAIGNALNLGSSPSVTRGIVSALDRSIEAPTGVLSDLIQTDAAINRGNSGGPLLNPQGQVIGLNTAIAADAQNIGFAIPIDYIKPLIEQLEQGGGQPPPAGGFLGVRTVPVNGLPSEIRDQFNVSASRGAFIDQVIEGTAADDAGLRTGDVIVGVDGSPVTGPPDLGALLREKAPDEQVTVTYERNGRRFDLDLRLGES